MEKKENLIVDKPYDVSVIDDNSAIITCPDAKKLQFIKVFPQLMADRAITVDKKCWGVDISDGEIYITCHGEQGKTGEVRVLDMNGNTKRRIGDNSQGMFIRPYCVAVSQSGERVFVSDVPRATVTCFTAQGDLLCQYKDKDDYFTNLRGMYVDATNNVLVCDHASNNLQIISPDGRKLTHDVVVPFSSYLPSSASIAVRDPHGLLVIGAFKSDYIFVFKLT